MNIKHILGTLWVVVSMAGGALASAGTPTLSIGNKAPAIQVDQWYKGKPISGFEPGKIHVVEFWATWCAPCKAAIPHITQLAGIYKGKVSFTGVCVFEEGEKIPARIRKFVTAMGSKMDYTVAGDTADKRMAKTWIEAAGENSIPQTFIVDGEGRIAWIGHPMGVEEPIKQLLAGTYDLEAAARKRSVEKDVASVSQKLEQGVMDALEAKDFDKAMAKLHEALDNGHPNKMLLIGNAAQGLYRLDENRANKEFEAMMASKDAADVEGAMGTLLDTDALSPRIYEFGIKGVQKMIATRPKDGFLWHLLAAGHFRLGEVGKALESEEKAIALLKADPEGSSEDMVIFQEGLAQYKKAMASSPAQQGNPRP